MILGSTVQHVERGWIGKVVHVGTYRHLIQWDNGKQSWCDLSWLRLVP